METTTLKQVLSFTTKLNSLIGDFVQFTKELQCLQDIHGWDNSLTFKIFNTKWISNQFVDLDEIHSFEDLYSLQNIFGASTPPEVAETQAIQDLQKLKPEDFKTCVDYNWAFLNFANKTKLPVKDVQKIYAGKLPFSPNEVSRIVKHNSGNNMKFMEWLKDKEYVDRVWQKAKSESKSSSSRNGDPDQHAVVNALSKQSDAMQAVLQKGTPFQCSFCRLSQHSTSDCQYKANIEALQKQQIQQVQQALQQQIQQSSQQQFQQSLTQQFPQGQFQQSPVQQFPSS